MINFVKWLFYEKIKFYCKITFSQVTCAVLAEIVHTGQKTEFRNKLVFIFSGTKSQNTFVTL